MVSTLKLPQVPNGTTPGVWRSKCPLLARHTRCKCHMETSQNKVMTSKTVISSSFKLTKRTNLEPVSSVQLVMLDLLHAAITVPGVEKQLVRRFGRVRLHVRQNLLKKRGTKYFHNKQMYSTTTNLHVRSAKVMLFAPCSE